MGKQSKFLSAARSTAIAVAACALCLSAAGCDHQQELASVDSEKEANRILVELEARGIATATKEQVKEQRKISWNIEVPAEDLARARSILVECDLPRETHNGYADMVEQTGLIPTKTEEQAKLIYAMAGELEKTFETYDRVVAARVHIVLPAKELFEREPTTRPTASAMVLLKYMPSTDAPKALPGKDDPDLPIRPQDAKEMVARSVEGLSPDQVFITYTKVAARPSAAPAVATAPIATAETSVPADRKLLMQLFGAVAAFGLISIILIVILVREKRKARQLALQS